VNAERPPRSRCRNDLAGQSRHREALDLLLGALPHNPNELAIHEQMWQTHSALSLEPSLVRRNMALTSEAVFYLDPHICRPQCHEWNTFVRGKLSPAKDSPAAEMAPID
jgi:hypothetical protein